MSATIAPVGAWCALDADGQLLPDTCGFYRHDVERRIPRGGRPVRVVIDVMESWEDRDAAAKAVDALPDCVACALLGVDENAPMEDVP